MRTSTVTGPAKRELDTLSDNMPTREIRTHDHIWRLLLD